MSDQLSTGRKRRSFRREFKRRVVEETLAPGASVSGVALRHGLNNNMVFKWRRRYLHELVPTRSKSVKLLPVSVVEEHGPATGVVPTSSSPQAQSSIELDWAGVRIRLHGPVDAEALRTVLAVVRER
jgi:transposase